MPQPSLTETHKIVHTEHYDNLVKFAPQQENMKK